MSLMIFYVLYNIDSSSISWLYFLFLALVFKLSNLTFLMTANMWHYSLVDSWVINFKSFMVLDSFHLPVFVPIIHLLVDEYEYTCDCGCVWRSVHDSSLCVCVWLQLSKGLLQLSVPFNRISHQFQHCPQFISIDYQAARWNQRDTIRSQLSTIYRSSFDFEERKKTKNIHTNHTDFYFIMFLVDTTGSCGAFLSTIFFSQISFSMAKERFLCKSIWSFAKLKFWFIFLFVEFVQLISSPHISWHIFE